MRLWLVLALLLSCAPAPGQKVWVIQLDPTPVPVTVGERTCAAAPIAFLESLDLTRPVEVTSAVEQTTLGPVRGDLIYLPSRLPADVRLVDYSPLYREQSDAVLQIRPEWVNPVAVRGNTVEIPRGSWLLAPGVKLPAAIGDDSGAGGCYRLERVPSGLVTDGELRAYLIGKLQEEIGRPAVATPGG
ncbi:MAG: hypothetical protein AB1758_34910 [Candidatus Eremiobacterota bacterium]